MCVSPISLNRVFGNIESFEPSDVEIEDREFVLGHQIRVRRSQDAGPNVRYCSLEVVSDAAVQLAFAVPGNVNGALVREDAYAVDAGLSMGSGRVGPHGEVAEERRRGGPGNRAEVRGRAAPGM